MRERAVFGCSELVSHLFLKVKRLLNAMFFMKSKRFPKASQPFSSDIRYELGGGEFLDTCSLLTVFLTNLQRGKGLLPPKCIMNVEGVRPESAWRRHSSRAGRYRATQSFIKETFSKRLLIDDDGPKAVASGRCKGSGTCYKDAIK